ncbi:MAG TPA: hypothetical protein VKY40_01450 [Halanaerobiales bacterium]|nr:hypothetical protein [Halanaerobiales bacterium]
MRFWNTLKQDIKYQFRHGFYYAYLVISILYILLLFNIPVELRSAAAGLIIFSDPAMLGFFFVGALILLERGENIFEGLFSTPLKPGEYMSARVLSLTLLALLVGFVIVIVVPGLTVNYILLLWGIVLTAVLFTLLGIVLVVRVKTVNQYIIYSIIYSVIFLVPVLEYLNIYNSVFYYLWPTKASLVLFTGAFGGQVKTIEVITAIFSLLVWIVIAGKGALHSFYRYIIMKIGDER